MNEYRETVIPRGPDRVTLGPTYERAPSLPGIASILQPRFVEKGLSDLLSRLDTQLQAAGEALAVIEARLAPEQSNTSVVGYAEAETPMLTPLFQRLLRQVAGAEMLHMRLESLNLSLAS